MSRHMKVGTKVRFVGQSRLIQQGDVGTILEARTDGWRMDYRIEWRGSGTWGADRDELKRIPPSGKHKPKIKAGDRVVVLYDHSPYFRTGDSGCVMKVDADGELFVQFEGQDHQVDDGLWYVDTKLVKLINK